jgi:predicted kinase
VNGPIDDCMEAIKQKMSKNNVKIVVDTLNLSLEERKLWVEEAVAQDVTMIEAVLFDVTATDCMKRWKKLGKEVTDDLQKAWKSPLMDVQAREGFTYISKCQKEAEWRKFINRLTHNVA